MTAFRSRLSVLALVTAGVVFAQDKEKPKTADKPENNSVEVRFADDSVVKMSLLQSSIPVATRYGRLTIPTTEIRRIEFGRRDEKPSATRNDTIVAAEFTVVGQIETAILKARTPYFGDATLKLAEMKSMRWLSSGRESKLMVDAAKYGGRQNAWLDTGIEIRSGASLQVVASGRVELGAQNGFPGGTMVVGPDGQSARGGRGGFNPNAPGGFAGGRGGRGGFGRGAMSAGALVGRIGETGSAFLVGTRYEAPAHADGKLYLRIVPSSDGSQATGSYEVRINAGR